MFGRGGFADRIGFPGGFNNKIDRENFNDFFEPGGFADRIGFPGGFDNFISASEALQYNVPPTVRDSTGTPRIGPGLSKKRRNALLQEQALARPFQRIF